MRLLLALAATFTLSFSAAQALDCAGGNYMADAEVVPPHSLGTVLRATQFAWDGGNRITQVCDLTASDHDFTAFWRLFTHEVNTEFAGVCIMLTGTNGRDVYSCATPEAVARARGAARGSRDFRLHFGAWQAGLQANIR